MMFSKAYNSFAGMGGHRFDIWPQCVGIIGLSSQRRRLSVVVVIVHKININIVLLSQYCWLCTCHHYHVFILNVCICVLATMSTFLILFVIVGMRWVAVLREKKGTTFII